MYNFPHYLEKIKWELNSLLHFKICIGFLRIVILGRLFQCCSLARIGSGVFSWVFLCERLKTHLSCYHWKHVFLLIHTGVPVRVSSTEMLSLFLACQASNKYVIAFQVQWPVCWDLKEDLGHVFHGDGRISQCLKEETTKKEELRARLEGRVSPWRKIAAFDQFCSEMSRLQCCVSSETLLTLWQLCHPRRSVLGHPAEKKRWWKGPQLCQSSIWWGIGRPLTICISMPASSLPISRS